MASILLFAGALVAQGTAPALSESESVDRVDVAYVELSQGRADAAIARIRASGAVDPAALINLGTAYARLGRTSEAQECFEKAIASRDRYDLELADGSWMDSRRAARKASGLLRTRETLALAARRGN